MQKLLPLTARIFCAYGALGQQQGIYSNFLLNDFYYNPAIAGSKNTPVLSVGYRNQWTGFPGAPVNINGCFYGSLKNKGKHGYGVSVLNEKIGITNKTGIYLNYAYHIKLGGQTKLGFGVRPGFIQYGVKLYDAQLADQGDAILTGNTYSASAIDLNSGFHLYSPKFFFMGSFNHLLGKSIQFTGYNSSLAFHYNLIGGYNIRFDKKKFVLQPSVMVKYTKPAPAQWTAMLKGTFDNKYWVGLIFRTEDAAGISVGMTIKDRLNVAYGYDYSIGALRKYNSGSHEIVISFVIPNKRPSLDEDDEKLNKGIMDALKKKKENAEPVEAPATTDNF
jgi:type IX secretion system PorP/SprF family membrane protein